MLITARHQTESEVNFFFLKSTAQEQNCINRAAVAKFTHIEHLANIAVLGGRLRELNRATTRGIISDKSKRIESRRVVVFAFAIALLVLRSSNYEQFRSSPTAACGKPGGT